MAFGPNPSPSKGRSRYPRWTTKDGTKVRLEDMSDKHIANAIKRLERQAQEGWPELVAQSYDALGIMPAGMNEQVQDELLEDNHWETCLHPMHEHLTREAERRGIDVEALT